MQNLRIDGIGTIGGGEYGAVTIDGVAKCTGDIHAESLSIDGVFKSSGGIRAGRLQCDGLATVRGDIHAGEIEVDGMLTLSGGTKIEATTLYCDGMIKMRGQISADRIDADGCVSADEIVGDEIVIESHRHGFWLFTRGRNSHSRISLIEATTVRLRGVEAESVNGKDVSIGPGCRIARVDCSGTLYISPKARVGSVTGEYTRRGADDTVSARDR